MSEETRFHTDQDRDYARGLLDDFETEGRQIEIATQWFCKARVETVRRVHKDGWQPIETAPKDKEVIVWDDGVMGEAYYDGEDDTWWWANTTPPRLRDQSDLSNPLASDARPSQTRRYRLPRRGRWDVR